MIHSVRQIATTKLKGAGIEEYMIESLPRLIHLFPFERLCIWHSISQLSRPVAPPFDHAVTWSASIFGVPQSLVDTVVPSLDFPRNG